MRHIFFHMGGPVRDKYLNYYLLSYIDKNLNVFYLSTLYENFSHLVFFFTFYCCRNYFNSFLYYFFSGNIYYFHSFRCHTLTKATIGRYTFLLKYNIIISYLLLPTYYSLVILVSSLQWRTQDLRMVGGGDREG